ncbi:MAG: histidine kinase [Acidobacteriota bacterium]
MPTEHGFPRRARSTGEQSPPSKRTGPSRRALFWILQGGGWGLFGAGMFVAGVTQWPVPYTAVVKSSLALLGFALSLVLRAIYRGLERLGVPLPGIVVAAAPLSYGAAGVWMAAHHLVVAAFVAAQRGAPQLAWRGFPDVTNTIYYFFLLGAWSALYFGVQAYLDLVAQRESLLRAESLAHRARLQALRLQLRPHFLFNTLNAISTLVADARTAEANRMLSRLSDFLRRTLEGPDDDEVSLEDEVDFARQYLEIEVVRFGDRLRVEISIAPEARNAMVPAMILQPLIENAVRHAVLAREEPGTISVLAVRDREWLTLEVHDDGPGLSEAAADPQGVGLANTRARLAELYGCLGELSLARSPLGGLAVSIRLPYRIADAGAA